MFVVVVLFFGFCFVFKICVIDMHLQCKTLLCLLPDPLLLLAFRSIALSLTSNNPKSVSVSLLSGPNS